MRLLHSGGQWPYLSKEIKLGSIELIFDSAATTRTKLFFFFINPYVHLDVAIDEKINLFIPIRLGLPALILDEHTS